MILSTSSSESDGASLCGLHIPGLFTTLLSAVDSKSGCVATDAWADGKRAARHRIVLRLTNRQIDVDEKGSLDKAQVISALQHSGEADYDSVSSSYPQMYHARLIARPERR